MRHTVILAAALQAVAALAQTTVPTTMPVPTPGPHLVPPFPEARMTTYGGPMGYSQPYMIGSGEIPPDVEQRASAVLQIDGPTATGFDGYRADGGLISMLVASTTFAESPVAKVLGLPPSTIGRQVIINAQQSNPRFVKLEVSLKKAEKAYAPDGASKLMASLIERLRVAMDESAQAEGKAQAARTAAAQEAADATKKRLAEVSDSLRAVRDVLGQAGDYSSDPTYQLNNLRNQRRNTESDLARLKAQLAGMLPEGGQDPVAAWETAVKSQEERLALLEKMSKNGQADAKEVADQKAKLAETQAQLTSARQQAMSNPTAARTTYSSSSIRNVRTQIAETEARLKQCNEQLAKLEDPEIAKKLASYRDMQQEEQNLRNQLMELNQRLSVSQRTTRERGAVIITVLDGAAQ